jgi:hypothetical protein
MSGPEGLSLDAPELFEPEESTPPGYLTLEIDLNALGEAALWSSSNNATSDEPRGRCRGTILPERSRTMHTGGILLTFATVCIGASVIIALIFRFWPRYGSVAAAVERSDHLLEQMEAPPAQH